MHCNSFVTALTFAAVAGVALAAPKAAEGPADMNNEIIPSGVVVTKNGESASASWGGFHASASLADDGSAAASAGNNVLGAGAGLYGTGAGAAGAGAGAGAGLYGTGAASSAGVPSKPLAGGYGNGGKPGGAGGVPLYHQGGTGNGFFDRIFAIPINVLQSVNTYLNQKQMHQGQQGATVNNGHGASAAASSSSASYGAGKAPEAAAGVGADYGHGPSGGAAAASASYGHGKPGAPMMVHTKTNYDEIFNIPITALRSVQNLLNG